MRAPMSLEKQLMLAKKELEHAEWHHKIGLKREDTQPTKRGKARHNQRIAERAVAVHKHETIVAELTLKVLITQ